MIGPVLSAPGVTLRPLTIAEAHGPYVGWFERSAVTRYLETTNPQSPDSLAKYIDRINASPAEALFGIFAETPPSHIGNIKLGPIAQRHRRASVGLIIGEPGFWGRGLGRRAIDLVAGYAFTELRLEKLTAGCVVANQGSRRAFAAAGFKEEALLVRHQRLPDGCWSDVVLLARFAPGAEPRPA